MPRLFEDEETHRISRMYQLYTPPRGIGGLGETEREVAANSLARLCYLTNRVVGVEMAALEIIRDPINSVHFEQVWTYSDLVKSQMCRLKKVAGGEVIFPTEELISRAFKKRKD